MGNFILCGFPRVGKSFLAEKFAKKIGYLYVDIDHLIFEDCSKLYQDVGETVFRLVEKKVVHAIYGIQKAVIACGGGTVLDSYNVIALKKMGKIIYLDFNKEVIQSRLTQKRLPKFIASIEEFEEVYAKRHLIYKSVADIVVQNEEQLWEVIRLGKSSRLPHGESRMERQSGLLSMGALRD